MLKDIYINTSFTVLFDNAVGLNLNNVDKNAIAMRGSIKNKNRLLMASLPPR